MSYRLKKDNVVKIVESLSERERLLTMGWVYAGVEDTAPKEAAKPSKPVKSGSKSEAEANGNT